MDARTLSITTRYDEDSETYIGSVSPQMTEYGYFNETVIAEEETQQEAYDAVLAKAKEVLQAMEMRAKECFLSEDELQAILEA